MLKELFWIWLLDTQELFDVYKPFRAVQTRDADCFEGLSDRSRVLYSTRLLKEIADDESSDLQRVRSGTYKVVRTGAEKVCID